MTDKKNWLQLLAYVTGCINQELLLRNEYLAAENHILKSQIKGRLRLSDGERATLAGIAKRLGHHAAGSSGGPIKGRGREHSATCTLLLVPT